MIISMITIDLMVQIIWFEQRETCIDASVDAGVTEFSLNLSANYIVIDSILHLLVPSPSRPTMVNTATQYHVNYGADQHCCL